MSSVTSHPDAQSPTWLTNAVARVRGVADALDSMQPGSNLGRILYAEFPDDLHDLCRYVEMPPPLPAALTTPDELQTLRSLRLMAKTAFQHIEALPREPRDERLSTAQTEANCALANMIPYELDHTNES